MRSPLKPDHYGKMISAIRKALPEFNTEWYSKHPEFAAKRHPALCAQNVNAIAREHNKRLLVDALSLVEKGHYNEDIKKCLAGIARGCSDENLASQVESLPYRTTMSTSESWILAMLHLFIESEFYRLQFLAGRCGVCESDEAAITKQEGTDADGTKR